MLAKQDREEEKRIEKAMNVEFGKPDEVCNMSDD